MKQRLITLALLAFLIGIAVYSVSAVQAQEANQEQELEQRSEINCQTGTYGQGQVCGVTTFQKARQRQEIVVRPHEVVNTALDAKLVAAIIGLAAAGTLSAIGFIKTKQL